MEPEEMQGTLLKGRWKIVKKIGQGAFGEIYSGADLTTQDPIAIKLERWDHKKVHPVHEQRACSPLMYACAPHQGHPVASHPPLPNGGWAEGMVGSVHVCCPCRAPRLFFLLSSSSPLWSSCAAAFLCTFWTEVEV